MPTLRQLQYFLAVADLASFSRAAERLHIAQPALSRQIMALEEELGALLLARHTRLVSLTAAGQCLRQRAARLLDDLDETCDEVRRIDAGAGVRLRVLHSSSVALAGALGQASATLEENLKEDIARTLAWLQPAALAMVGALILVTMVIFWLNYQSLCLEAAA